MSKYDVKFCTCGRIHFIEYDEIYKAQYEEKEILLVCNNCGTTLRIGIDCDNCFYSVPCYNEEIEPTSILKIICSHGNSVMMKTGNAATNYGIEFIDWGTQSYFNKGIDNYDELRRIVDSNLTKRLLNDDNKWKSLSGYLPFFKG